MYNGCSVYFGMNTMKLRLGDCDTYDPEKVITKLMIHPTLT